MYGDADRRFAKLIGDTMHGAPYSYDYEDLGSWNVKQSKWTQEKIVGNYPSQRTEMGCVYNPKLDKLILFEGFSPWMPIAKDSGFMYADTFILESNSPGKSSCEQVLTREFSAHRTQSIFCCDPEFGKTFLYGCYTNDDYIPNSKGRDRAYGDLWQLRLDMEYGDFDNVDLESESRLAQAGPWQRCFNCCATGMWKK